MVRGVTFKIWVKGVATTTLNIVGSAPVKVSRGGASASYIVLSGGEGPWLGMELYSKYSLSLVSSIVLNWHNC